MIAEETLTIATADGVALDGRVCVPPGARAGIVVCHPHPLYGGDQDNPVVVRAVEVAAGLGLATVRFNFRGVGRSSGSHGEGRAEMADARAALNILKDRLPDTAPRLLAGYSFGAMVAAQVAVNGPPAGLAMIAPPLSFAEVPPLAALPDTLPVLVLAGTNDRYCPPEALRTLEAALPWATVEVIPGADHFFFGRLHPLGEALARWLERVLHS